MDDLRRTTGLLFAILGGILLIYGLAKPDIRAALDSDVNVNLWTGLTLFVFGGCLLWLSVRTRL
jgi:hypothetical protein